MKHSKKHEKNNSFLEEVNYYGAINIMKSISDKSYYYWLHKIGLEAYEQLNVPSVTQPTGGSFTN